MYSFKKYWNVLPSKKNVSYSLGRPLPTFQTVKQLVKNVDFWLRPTPRESESWWMSHEVRNVNFKVSLIRPEVEDPVQNQRQNETWQYYSPP